MTEEIEPDLDKAPPHVEGELLKQNSKAVLGLGKKGWKSYFFTVHKDKLQYFRKKDEQKIGKDPIAYIRLSHVMDITEAVFSQVPNRHHLNCGFSIVTLLPQQQKQTFNLLAETPESMKNWVQKLRYIKAYWSKVQVRETVISEEQERKLLEKLLQEEEDEDGNVLVGNYSIDEDLRQGSTDWDSKVFSIPVRFADSSKMTIKVFATDMVSDILKKVEDKLQSSIAQLWVVDSHGNEKACDPNDSVLLYHPSTYQFFVVDPSHRVLVVFIGSLKDTFEAIIMPVKSTAKQVMEDTDVDRSLSLHGITNRGLFLHGDKEELLFDLLECPCEALFLVHLTGEVERLPVGKLVVKNKALGGAHRTLRSGMIGRMSFSGGKRHAQNESSSTILEEEEDAQIDALNKIHMLRRGLVGSGSSRLNQSSLQHTNIREDPDDSPPKTSTGHAKGKSSILHAADGSSSPEVSRRQGGSSPGEFHRTRSNAFRRRPGKESPQFSRPNTTITSSSSPSPPTISPAVSPRLSPRSNRHNTTSFSALEEDEQDIVELHTDQAPPVMKQSVSPNFSPQVLPMPSASPRSFARTTMAMKQSIRRRAASTIAESMTPQESRSNYFGGGGGRVPGVTHSTGPSAASLAASLQKDSERLDHLFSQSYKDEQDRILQKELSQRVQEEQDKALLLASASAGQSRGRWSENTATQSEKGSTSQSNDQDASSEDEEPPIPLVIDLDNLRQPVTASFKDAELSEENSSEGATRQPLVAVPILRPSLLKVMLLRTHALPSTAESDQSHPPELMNLSGVVLSLSGDVWQLQDGYNYHNPLPDDAEDVTETFTLPGGIRAIYSSTSNRWHVLPSLTPPTPPVQGPESESRSDVSTGPNTTSSSDMELLRYRSFYQQKRAIATEIGSAFHEILDQFKCSKTQEEKKKIASDMTNIAIGHLFRQRFCTAIASLLLDGMILQRFAGLMQQDLWKAVNSFFQEGAEADVSSNMHSLMEARVMRPIRAESRLFDNNMRFRSFICLIVSRGVFLQWLGELPTRTTTIKKFYNPGGFLYRVACRDDFCCKLFDEILLSLQPMEFFPFELSIDFEVKQKEEISPASSLAAAENSPKSSPAFHHHTERAISSSEPQETLSKVVMATGQRTTDASPTAFVNPHYDSSVPQANLSTSPLLAKPTTATPPTLKQAVKHLRVENMSSVPAGPTWLKKLSKNLANLNVGGAITGAPRSTSRQQTHLIREQQQAKPPTEHIPSLPSEDSQDKNSWKERPVETLYDSVAEEADELSFLRGEILIVKDKVNTEWLLCRKGEEIGIVPMNYVRPLADWTPQS